MKSLLTVIFLAIGAHSLWGATDGASRLHRRRLSELPEKYEAAARAVAAALVKADHDPKDYRAVVEERPTQKIFVFHLWHLSAFAKEREAKMRGSHVIGNPGGKCVDINFDLRTEQASAPMLWQ